MSEPHQPGLPGPTEGPNDGPKTGNSSAAADSAGRRGFRSVEECLYAINQLPTLVLMKTVTPAQANAMRGALRDIIEYLQRPAGGSSTTAPIGPDLLDRLRRDPQLMNFLEPFLTADQIAALMRDSPDGHTGR